MKPVDKDELRYETMLKMFFGSEDSIEDTINHIRRFEKDIQIKHNRLSYMFESLKSVLDEDEAHIYYLITANFGLETYASHLKWCKYAINKLEERL